MKQKIKRWIIYFILMAIFFVLFYLILEKIYWIFINEKVTTEKNNDDLLILKNIIQSILSFFFANVVNIFRLRFDTKKENDKDIPYLHMNILDVSGIRRHLKKSTSPEVIIGTGTYFIYVNIRIENVGEGILENCKLADTKLKNVRLSAKDNTNILLRIYVDGYGIVDEILHIKFSFSDTKERYYKKEFRMKLKASENDETVAEIVASKKQRRTRQWQK